MDRRSFLQGVALTLAAGAAKRAFPFRVYSIPKTIVIASPGDVFAGEMQILAGTPPVMFGRVSDPPDTATGAELLFGVRYFKEVPSYDGRRYMGLARSPYPLLRARDQ